MRAGIRQHLIDTVSEINNCYEITVPTKDTVKPYAVIIQCDDTDSGNIVGFKRTIEIWLHEDKTTFVDFDLLTEKVINALDMQVIEDISTNETFNCVYGGAIEKDIVDENLNVIIRKLKFIVIGLHEEDEANKDSWLDALSNYTKVITDKTVYCNNWKKNFHIPSILWRVKNQSKERVNNSLIKENKTLICHVASNNKNEIYELLDHIEDRLISDSKIPLDLENKRYLTIESIEEDREADMLSKGQLTIKLFRRKTIEINNGPTIDKIYSSGQVKES